MVLYEIDIHRNNYRQPVDMTAVYAALEHASISFDKDERRGGQPPIEGEQPEYVYVDSDQLGQAVRLINGLGYTTDEDVEEEDEEA